MERDPIPPPSKERRWDIDQRGDGVADASAAVGRIDALRAHAERKNWIAEEPDLHLWPHIERAVAMQGSPWNGAQWSTDPDGRLVIDLRPRRVDGDPPRAELRADVLRLVGSFIESSTYIEIDRSTADGALVVDVVTGVLDDQTSFKAHGHTIRFRVNTTVSGRPEATADT